MAEKYSYLEFAEETLEASSEPLIYQDIWELGKEKGFSLKLATKGKTPWASLGSYLFVDVRDNPKTKFIKVGKNPTRFYLKNRELSKNIENELNEKELKSIPVEKVKDWNERELHQVFAYFAYANT